ncbi:MAG: D-sedoheptulose-7-phosphate isomerase [Bacteroidota bacterium]
MNSYKKKFDSNEHICKLFSRHPELEKIRKNITNSLTIISESQEKGGSLLLCGNGGSAADCEHISGELLKSFHLKRSLSDKRKESLRSVEGLDLASIEKLENHIEAGFKVFSLTGNTSLQTAVINDIGGEFIFAQQIEAIGREGDVLMVLSTSGNAENVHLAAAVAKAKKMKVIGLTGRSGGKVMSLCDEIIKVPADLTPDVQELHLPVYHTICAALESEFFQT